VRLQSHVTFISSLSALVSVVMYSVLHTLSCAFFWIDSGLAKTSEYLFNVGGGLTIDASRFGNVTR
jgi:hypothetical protein